MAGSFGKRLRSVDIFGHPINLQYKGSASYQSLLGAVLTLAVYALTFVLFIKGIKEVIMMQDPELTSYEKPLSLEERNQTIPVTLADYSNLIIFKTSYK